MKIDVKLLYNNSEVPFRGTEYSAGYDLKARLENNATSIAIPAHTTVKIGTGVAVAIPEGYAGLVFARSGMAAKRCLRPANAVGVIDSDYRNEIIVALHNDSNFPQVIMNGERMAQLVVMPFETVEWNATAELNETARGMGGFGSTGTK